MKLDIESIKQLPPRELRKICQDNNVKLARRDTTRKAILAKIERHNKKLVSGSTVKKTDPRRPTDPSEPRPARPDFEALTAGAGDTDSPASANTPTSREPIQDEPAPPPSDGNAWGGRREGAGRPQGLTDEIARARRCAGNQTPDPNLVFTLWVASQVIAGSIKIEEAALSKEDAEKLGLPVTNLFNFYCPDVEVPPVVELWVSFGLVANEVLVPHVRKCVEIYNERKKPKSDKSKRTDSDRSPGKEGQRENSQGTEPDLEPFESFVL